MHIPTHTICYQQTASQSVSRIKSNGFRTAFALILLAIGASATAVAQEVTLPAKRHAILDVHTRYESGHCGSFGATLSTRGANPLESKIIDAWKSGVTGYDQWPVGYRNHKKQGSDPFPCNKWDLAATQFAFTVDLTAIPRDAMITSAYLSWKYIPFDDALLVPGFAVNRPYKSCVGEGFEVGLADPLLINDEELKPGLVSEYRGGSGDNGGFGTSTVFNSAYTMRPMLPYTLNVPVPFPAEVSDDSESEVRHQVDISWLTTEDIHLYPDFNGFVLSPPRPPASSPVVWERTDNREKYMHCMKIISDVSVHLGLAF